MEKLSHRDLGGRRRLLDKRVTRVDMHFKFDRFLEVKYRRVTHDVQQTVSGHPLGAFLYPVVRSARARARLVTSG